MPRDPLSAVRTRGVTVPQSRPADPAQSLNAAGGYTYTVAWEQRLLRFLVLGTTGGTYYATESEHTADNAAEVRTILDEHGVEAVALIRDVSVRGRAPKQNATLFALALAASASDPATRKAALDAVPEVCRTGTMLFQFVGYAEQFRGWGRALRRAIAGWYERSEDEAADLALQVVKYRAREGWSHADLLRLSKPRPPRGSQVDRVLGFAAGKVDREADVVLPAIIDGYLAVQTADVGAATRLVVDYGLPWETLPDRLINEPAIWRALLPTLGAHALIRQLPRLTRLGVLDDTAAMTMVTEHLTNSDRLVRQRVHPMTALNALAHYRTGQARSGGAYSPKPRVLDALDAAFYASFGSIEPVGGNVLVACDVSPSMWGGTVAGTALTPAECTGALALLMVATEPDCAVVAFASADTTSRYGYGRGRAGIEPVPLSAKQRLDDVMRTMKGYNNRWGGTDCALPVTEAMTRQAKVDLFVSITDNETWAGPVHPHKALEAYRDRMSRPQAKMATVAMTATRSTLTNPGDSGMLDVVGFDTATPNLLTAFARGEV